MKKDRMFELMTELRDRQFDLKECCELFHRIDLFLSNRIDWIEGIGTITEQMNYECFEICKMELERTLSAFGLDYTTDEFITED